MEYQCIEWSQLLEKKIKEKCPLCIIEWFYDKNNLQGQKKTIARVEIYLIQVIHDLYFYGKVFHFYIRIHKYKDWYVVRIFTKKSLSQKLINKINKKLRKNKITMVNVVYHNQYTVIKMIC